jgi:uncharacterized protein (TIGR02302 family)
VTTPRSARRYRLLLSLARAVVFGERLAGALWPAAVVIRLFLALALLDLLPRLPNVVHGLVLVAFAMALAVALVRGLPALHPVDRQAARRRLEQDSALDHRPLAALEDRLAAGAHDPVARALWDRHRIRMAEAARHLRLRPPSAGLDQREPWGIRAGVLLMLTIGLAVGWTDPGARLLRAFDPGVAFLATPAEPMVELWLSPPTYTRRPPVFLDRKGASDPPADATAAPISVPHGTTVLARVSGVTRLPTLKIGEQDIPFAPLETPGPVLSARAEGVIQGGDRLAVHQGRRTLAAWSLEVVPDLAPSILFTEAPAAVANGRLGFAFEASDDYGVEDLTAVIRSTEAPPGGDGQASEIRFPLTVSTIDGLKVAGRIQQDLSAHRWAGRPVVLHLEAADRLGQVGSSPAAAMTLPERTFSHPVARAIVAERRRLDDETDAMRDDVARRLAELGSKPDHFARDLVVSLGLAVAGSRLLNDRGGDAVDSVRRLLWSLALRTEEGDVPFAEQAVAEARERLLEALRRNAPDSEIERLTEDLQKAIERYLSAVIAELARREPPDARIDGEIETLRAEDLRDLVDMVREMAKTGAREGAERLLSELQRMLDGIRAGLQMGGAREDLMEAQSLKRALSDLLDRQQSLLDKTFQQLRSRRGGSDRNQGARGGQENQAGSEAQEALRRELGELMLRLDSFLGSIPDGMGEAERAMRDAARALEGNRPGDALPQQGAAVDALSRARDALGQALAQRFGGTPGLQGGGEDEGTEGHGDIFGRAPGDGRRGFGQGRVGIPDASELQRAQEILNELQRRAGERARPTDELDYIERLLRRF